ncbi:unnamed protein product [Amoebophrya sp. A25]|nr:unnamed protein product [Amoebophrya sp. A25]|eukprot:GSA25T00019141001.1
MSLTSDLTPFSTSNKMEKAFPPASKVDDPEAEVVPSGKKSTNTMNSYGAMDCEPKAKTWKPVLKVERQVMHPRQDLYTRNWKKLATAITLVVVLLVFSGIGVFMLLSPHPEELWANLFGNTTEARPRSPSLRGLASGLSSQGPVDEQCGGRETVRGSPHFSWADTFFRAAGVSPSTFFQSSCGVSSESGAPAPTEQDRKEAPASLPPTPPETSAGAEVTHVTADGSDSHDEDERTRAGEDGGAASPALPPGAPAAEPDVKGAITSGAGGGAHRHKETATHAGDAAPAQPPAPSFNPPATTTGPANCVTTGMCIDVDDQNDKKDVSVRWHKFCENLNTFGKRGDESKLTPEKNSFDSVPRTCEEVTQQFLDENLWYANSEYRSKSNWVNTENMQQSCCKTGAQTEVSAPSNGNGAANEPEAPAPAPPAPKMGPANCVTTGKCKRMNIDRLEDTMTKFSEPDFCTELHQIGERGEVDESKPTDAVTSWTNGKVPKQCGEVTQQYMDQYLWFSYGRSKPTGTDPSKSHFYWVDKSEEGMVESCCTDAASLQASGIEEKPTPTGAAPAGAAPPPAPKRGPANCVTTRECNMLMFISRKHPDGVVKDAAGDGRCEKMHSLAVGANTENSEGAFINRAPEKCSDVTPAFLESAFIMPSGRTFAEFASLHHWAKKQAVDDAGKNQWVPWNKGTPEFKTWKEKTQCCRVKEATAPGVPAAAAGESSTSSGRGSALVARPVQPPPSGTGRGAPPFVGNCVTTGKCTVQVCVGGMSNHGCEYYAPRDLMTRLEQLDFCTDLSTYAAGRDGTLGKQVNNKYSFAHNAPQSCDAVTQQFVDDNLRGIDNRKARRDTWVKPSQDGSCCMERVTQTLHAAGTSTNVGGRLSAPVAKARAPPSLPPQPAAQTIRNTASSIANCVTTKSCRRLVHPGSHDSGKVSVDDMTFGNKKDLCASLPDIGKQREDDGETPDHSFTSLPTSCSQVTQKFLDENLWTYGSEPKSTGWAKDHPKACCKERASRSGGTTTKLKGVAAALPRPVTATRTTVTAPPSRRSLPAGRAATGPVKNCVTTGNCIAELQMDSTGDNWEQLDVMDDPRKPILRCEKLSTLGKRGAEANPEGYSFDSLPQMCGDVTQAFLDQNLRHQSSKQPRYGWVNNQEVHMQKPCCKQA